MRKFLDMNKTNQIRTGPGRSLKQKSLLDKLNKILRIFLGVKMVYKMIFLKFYIKCC